MVMPGVSGLIRRIRSLRNDRRTSGAVQGFLVVPFSETDGLAPAPAFRIMNDTLKILVVEDEKSLAHITAMMLGGPTAKVTTARNGWEALIKIGAAPAPYDVVVTDHRMPRMSGLEMVRQLRKKNFGGKILVLSAHLAEEEIQAYEEQNVDMMMTKPFDFDELQDAMAVLNKKASVLTGV